MISVEAVPTISDEEKMVMPSSIPVMHKNGPFTDPHGFELDESSDESIRSFLMEEINIARTSAPLSAYCFMSGFLDAVSFSEIFLWCGFQTGNSAQLAMALARLLNGKHDYSFHVADQQALVCLLGFISGALFGRIGTKIGYKTRLWMTLGTFIQALLTMAAAIALWKSGSSGVAKDRGDPVWTDTLSFVTVGLMSASMGLQGIMAKHLHTEFSATVVLTTTWCEIMMEPQLFHFHRLVASRDHMAMTILSLFTGSFVSRSLLQKIGTPGTLGVGTGLRILIALGWLFVPAKQRISSNKGFTSV